MIKTGKRKRYAAIIHRTKEERNKKTQTQGDGASKENKRTGRQKVSGQTTYNRLQYRVLGPAVRGQEAKSVEEDPRRSWALQCLGWSAAHDLLSSDKEPNGCFVTYRQFDIKNP